MEIPVDLSVKQDLSGKVAIVTGGNTGLGYELVKGLAEMGAHTIMASRSEERATAVRTTIANFLQFYKYSCIGNCSNEGEF